MGRAVVLLRLLGMTLRARVRRAIVAALMGALILLVGCGGSELPGAPPGDTLPPAEVSGAGFGQGPDPGGGELPRGGGVLDGGEIIDPFELEEWVIVEFTDPRGGSEELA